MKQVVGAVVWVLCLPPLSALAQTPVSLTDLEPLVAELQAVVEDADGDAFRALLTPDADPVAAAVFTRGALRPGISRAVLIGRFLAPVDEDAPDPSRYLLTVEVFTETGDQARLQTWQLEVTRTPTADGGAAVWRISSHASPDTIEGLYHLTLDPATQYDAAGLVITAEDMELRMASGAAFVSEISSGITGLVLVGDGTLAVSPEPEAERRQMEIFSGQETLETEFTHAFVRLNPLRLGAHVSGELTPTDVDERRFEQAQELFDQMSGLTFVVDLSDFSRRPWWLTPSTGNLVAEIRTEEFGDLTYTLAEHQPENVSLYTRTPRKVVLLYPSASKRAAQGRYYGTGATAPFDVLDYDITASLEPRGVGRESLGARPTLLGCWFEATARLALRVGDTGIDSLSLHLAEELRVHAVQSLELGSLLFFRMSGRDDMIVHLPGEVPAGSELTLIVRYSGLLEAEELDENWIGRMRLLDVGGTVTYGIPERRYLYSNASHWYPQPARSDYATATMTLTIPASYGVIASGDASDENPPLAAADADDAAARTFSFVTIQPTRYLSCLITRFAPSDTPAREVLLDDVARAAVEPIEGAAYDSLALAVEANAYGRDRVGEFAERAAQIMQFYASLVGDIPYPSFTLALSDSRLPGGHSPAYFAVLNHPLPVHGRLMRTWETDPVAFSSFPSFFLAHELAHQWWGQAVGWKNYHEQWLSEGLSQYFAALYAHDALGDEVFGEILEQLRRWSLRHSDQGPVYLGYRLGHLEEEPRVFRALVYNKGALVLHMLRRVIGDEAFFAGLRRFYRDMRFRVAGTDDLVEAFEHEAGRPLGDFFTQWIHEFDVPRLQFDTHVEPDPAPHGAVVVTFHQEDKLFEVPVSVTLQYESGARETVTVPVRERVTEWRVPLGGRLRDLDVNEDHAALAEIRPRDGG